jgi:AraC-like DNA-binding protein
MVVPAAPDDVWRDALGTAFGRLAPVALGARAATGAMSGTRLGPMAAFQVTGTPQVVRRTPAAVRQAPIDLLKVCVQLAGRATVCQDDREVQIRPGQMAIYDTGRPYQLRLEHLWSCAVVAFPRDALSLPNHVVAASMSRAFSLAEGPGAVLAGFIAAAVQQQASIGAAAGRLGEAGLHLVAATLGTCTLPDGDAAADALRLQVLQYVRAHLAEPDLTHDSVAAVHRMAGRTLHRLFEHEPYTVTEYIRNRRLEAAMRDLTDPLFMHRNIAGIAARWCFVGQAHFTRAFQARYGLTPSAARRAATVPAVP